MSQQFGSDDGHEGLASALNFSGTRPAADDDLGSLSGALRFSGAGDEGSQESAVDAFRGYAPTESDDATTGLDAVRAQKQPAEEDQEDDENAGQLVTVGNPAGTVSVSALLGGMTQRVTLSTKATTMTSAELAGEIVALAARARNKALVALHAHLAEDPSVAESAQQMGVDSSVAVAAQLKAAGMILPSE